MTEGSIFYAETDSDMIEFMRWVRSNGGEVVCTDYERKILEVIRGTENETKSQLFNRDGVLGSVNVSDRSTGEAEQA